MTQKANTKKETPETTKKCCSEDSRRKFIVVSTVTVSAACGLFPLASGITTVFDPVKKKLRQTRKGTVD